MNGKQVAARVGATYRQVDTWTRLGYLKPGLKGRRRHYPDAEVDVAVRMACLVRAGVAPPTAAAVARGELRAVATLEAALELALRRPA